MAVSETGYLAGSPLAFAHRGGRHHGVSENTQGAFAAAVAAGFTHLETDVRLSRDGVPVAFHDATLQRVAEDPRRVSEVDAGELAELALPQGGRIPTLRALLDAFPQTFFNVDFKDHAVVEPALEVIEAADARRRVLIAGFSGKRLRRVRAYDPQLATATSPGEILALLNGFTSALGVRGAAVAAQVPVSVAGVTIVSPGFVKRCHQRGLQVHVWTVNEPAQMRRLLDLGVDGIISDELEALVEVFTERGLWPPAKAASAAAGPEAASAAAVPAEGTGEGLPLAAPEESSEPGDPTEPGERGEPVS